MNRSRGIPPLFWYMLVILLAGLIVYSLLFWLSPSWTDDHEWTTVNEWMAEQSERDSDDDRVEDVEQIVFPIQLNTATSTELQALPGIGVVKAQAIIDYRESIGSFDEVDQLLEVKGIGEKTLEAIKPLLTLENSP